MEIKIKINDRLVRCVKGIFNRRSAPFMLAVVFFCVLVILFAEPFVIPYVFKTGEVISSSQMNANLEQLEDRVNALQTQVDALVSGSGSLYGLPVHLIFIAMAATWASEQRIQVKCWR